MRSLTERGEHCRIEERVDEQGARVRRDQIQRPEVDLRRAQTPHPAHPATAPHRLLRDLARERADELVGRCGAEPGTVDLMRLAAAARLPKRRRRGCEEKPRAVARNRPLAPFEHGGEMSVAARVEDVVAAEPGQDRAVARHLLAGTEEVRVQRPEKTVPPQAVPRDRPEQVELVAELLPDPVLDPEVRDDLFLPCRTRRSPRPRSDT